MQSQTLIPKLLYQIGSDGYNYQQLKDLYPIVNGLREWNHHERSVEQFLDWLILNDVDIRSLSIKNTLENGLGIFSIRFISKNEQIIKVPLKLMITSIPTEPLLQKMVSNDKLLQSVPNMVLILRLSQEYLSQGFWEPYVNVLPKQINLPMFYSLEQLEELRNLSVFNDVVMDWFLSLKQYSHLCSLLAKYPLFPLEKFTFSLFEWAKAITLTRQNPIVHVVDGKEIQHLALIPVYDMFNHIDGTITSEFDAESHQAMLYANADYETESEIFMCYGSRSNQELFLYSGFVTDSTANDSFKLPLSIPKNDKLIVKRRKVLELFDLQDGMYTVSLPLMQRSGTLLAFLYICNLTELELDDVLNTNYMDFNQVSAQCQKKTLSWLSIKATVQKKMLESLKLKNPLAAKLCSAEVQFWSKLIQEIENIIQ